MIRCIHIFVLLALSVNPCFAQDSTVIKKDLDISAQCNVYMPFLGRFHKNDIPGGAGVEPIVIDVRGIKAVSFENTSGTISFMSSVDSMKNSADGGTFGLGTAVNGYGMLTGIWHSTKIAFLVGVFLSDAAIENQTHPSIDFLEKEDYELWGPDAGQVFFIGDGLTSKGKKQVLLVPEDAISLYIGFADALKGDPSNYDDNSGSIHTTIVLHKTFKYQSKN